MTGMWNMELTPLCHGRDLLLVIIFMKYDQNGQNEKVGLIWFMY